MAQEGKLKHQIKHYEPRPLKPFDTTGGSPGPASASSPCPTPYAGGKMVMSLRPVVHEHFSGEGGITRALHGRGWDGVMSDCDEAKPVFDDDFALGVSPRGGGNRLDFWHCRFDELEGAKLCDAMCHFMWLGFPCFTFSSLSNPLPHGRTRARPEGTSEEARLANRDLTVCLLPHPTPISLPCGRLCQPPHFVLLYSPRGPAHGAQRAFDAIELRLSRNPDFTFCFENPWDGLFRHQPLVQRMVEEFGARILRVSRPHHLARTLSRAGSDPRAHVRSTAAGPMPLRRPARQEADGPRDEQSGDHRALRPRQVQVLPRQPHASARRCFHLPCLPAVRPS